MATIGVESAPQSVIWAPSKESDHIDGQLSPVSCMGQQAIVWEKAVVCVLSTDERSQRRRRANLGISLRPVVPTIYSNTTAVPRVYTVI